MFQPDQSPGQRNSSFFAMLFQWKRSFRAGLSIDAAAWHILSSRGAKISKAADYLFLTIAADRKSTRLNSSHSQISYAVFCLKKKKKPQKFIPVVLIVINMYDAR